MSGYSVVSPSDLLGLGLQNKNLNQIKIALKNATGHEGDDYPTRPIPESLIVAIENDLQSRDATDPFAKKIVEAVIQRTFLNAQNVSRYGYCSSKPLIDLRPMYQLMLRFGLVTAVSNARSEEPSAPPKAEEASTAEVHKESVTIFKSQYFEAITTDTYYLHKDERTLSREFIASLPAEEKIFLLGVAAECGDTDLVKWLVEDQKVPVDSAYQRYSSCLNSEQSLGHFCTPLMIAAKMRHYPVAQYLLEQGADANIQCPLFASPTIAPSMRMDSIRMLMSYVFLDLYARGSDLGLVLAFLTNLIWSVPASNRSQYQDLFNLIKTGEPGFYREDDYDTPALYRCHNALRAHLTLINELDPAPIPEAQTKPAGTKPYHWEDWSKSLALKLIELSFARAKTSEEVSAIEAKYRHFLEHRRHKSLRSLVGLKAERPKTAVSLDAAVAQAKSRFPSAPPAPVNVGWVDEGTGSNGHVAGILAAGGTLADAMPSNNDTSSLNAKMDVCPECPSVVPETRVNIDKVVPLNPVVPTPPPSSTGTTPELALVVADLDIPAEVRVAVPAAAVAVEPQVLAEPVPVPPVATVIEEPETLAPQSMCSNVASLFRLESTPRVVTQVQERVSGWFDQLAQKISDVIETVKDQDSHN